MVNKAVEVVQEGVLDLADQILVMFTLPIDVYI